MKQHTGGPGTPLEKFRDYLRINGVLDTVEAPFKTGWNVAKDLNPFNWHPGNIGSDLLGGVKSLVSGLSPFGSEVSKLKQQIQGEIVVYASRPLVRTLMEHDLVDELRLTVCPVAVGAGERLFGETSDKRPLRLIHTKTVGNGLAHLTYERAREA